MAQYSWATCPAEVRSQIEQFLTSAQDALRENLIGVYLHGSLAMGCFNPARSDLDLLVITKQPMIVKTKRSLGEALLRLSRQPAPIEISFLSAGQFIPWRYPTPYDLHYSEDWRSRFEEEVWRDWNHQHQEDSDLAAHITITHARGICLLGQPIDATFPLVPAQDYQASIWEDFLGARAQAWDNPPYFVLNACRVAAYLLEGRICSKDEGGAWALQVVPEAFRSLIIQALNIYRGEEQRAIEAAALEAFGAYMKDWLRPLITSAQS